MWLGLLQFRLTVGNGLNSIYHDMLRRVILPCSPICQSRLLSSLPSTSRDDCNELNKNVVDGIAHVTSLNILTRERSVVRLKLAESQKIRKIRRQYAVPEPALAGLRSALISCSRPPKQLQHEADQLSEYLAQRRFPAPPSVVKQARDKIKEMLKHQQVDDGIEDLVEKDKETRINYKLRNEVDKILKKAHFNWKPLDIETREAAAAYALSRLAPNYAEIARVLDEFDRSQFTPSTVLDYGSGIGAGFWAVNERFGTNVKNYCMVDPSPSITQFAMDIMRGETNDLLFRNVSFRRHLVPSLQTKYDLVIAHRTLCELASQESRLDLVASLWKRTNRFLVLIDSGLRDAYEALIEARDFLLCSGTQLHLDETRSILKEKNLLSDSIESVLRDRSLSDFERFSLVRDMVPADITLPTALEPATVYAPCPHDLGCPKLGNSVCSFPVRWQVIRADGKRSPREKSGSETGKFSYMILEKGFRQPESIVARILKITHSSGHVTCDLCTKFKGLQRVAISRRTGELYQRTRSRRDGEQFPLEEETVVTESLFDLCDLKNNSKNIQ
ncbi:unnamed protein product [Cylicocyclus nassatus]|uniref:Methyltransferase-like protein 17, mitochondrial n=1 Tax=Cylicocyclus nassatus TaxID=53992 RepID=A0AA36GLC1_CYLNA|nr:unnamed protein product [Cylicocyclus nassatus]